MEGNNISLLSMRSTHEVMHKWGCGITVTVHRFSTVTRSGRMIGYITTYIIDAHERLLHESVSVDSNVRGLTITYVHCKGLELEKWLTIPSASEYLQKLRVQIVYLIGLLYNFNSHSHLVWNPVLMSISLKNFGCLYASLMLTISPNKKQRVTLTSKCLKILKTNGLIILLTSMFQCMSGSLITRAFGTNIMKLSDSG